jgi:hypothetical protein
MKKIILCLLIASSATAQPVYIVKKVAKMKKYNFLLIKIENIDKGIFMPKFANYKDTTRLYKVGDTLQVN